MHRTKAGQDYWSDIAKLMTSRDYEICASI